MQQGLEIGLNDHGWRKLKIVTQLDNLTEEIAQNRAAWKEMIIVGLQPMQKNWEGFVLLSFSFFFKDGIVQQGYES